MLQNTITNAPAVQDAAKPVVETPTTIEFQLKHGFRVVTNGMPVFHKTVVMREAITEDLFEAERLVDSERPIAFNGALMGRQIVKIGDHPGPLSLKEMGRLKKDDYALIREKQMELERLGESE